MTEFLKNLGAGLLLVTSVFGFVIVVFFAVAATCGEFDHKARFIRPIRRVIIALLIGGLIFWGAGYVLRHGS